jgi:hypothetical protein
MLSYPCKVNLSLDHGFKSPSQKNVEIMHTIFDCNKNFSHGIFKKILNAFYAISKCY